MEQQQRIKIMAETAQHLVDLIQKRMNQRFAILNALQTSPLDNLPNDVKMMREIEAKAVRAVMQEQSDIMDMINALFPSVRIAPSTAVPMVSEETFNEIKSAVQEAVSKTPAKKKRAVPRKSTKK